MSSADLLAGLSPAEHAALLTIPLPRDADPARWIAARPYSSTWRKSSKHYRAMLSLERLGVVQRTESRGETLWRCTKPLGLSLRARASQELDNAG